MQIIDNVCILHIVGTAIYQWKWWNEFEIKILNGLKQINVFMNMIDEKSVSEETTEKQCDWAYKRTHTLTSPQILIY